MALSDEVEAISIAVPTSPHHAVVKDSLQAGVHVLVEKPIAVTRGEALELIELANASPHSPGRAHRTFQFRDSSDPIAHR